jgi:hypothetical protein
MRSTCGKVISSCGKPVEKVWRRLVCFVERVWNLWGKVGAMIRIAKISKVRICQLISVHAY